MALGEFISIPALQIIRTLFFCLRQRESLWNSAYAVGDPGEVA